MIPNELIDLVAGTAMSAADWIGKNYWRRFGVEQVRPSTSPAPKIIAHRGAWKKPGLVENTLPAFMAAIEAGCWGIEFDLRALKDGTLVIHHDDSLARTFGRELRLSEMTHSHLQHEVPVIPTLEDTIRAVAPHAHMMIELKGSSEEWTDLLLARLIQSLGSLRIGTDYHLMSLDPRTLIHLGEQNPKLRDGFVGIAGTHVRAVSELVLREKWKALAAHWLLLPQDIIARHHRAGQLCGTGYSESKECFARECGRNVDWIFSNQGHIAPNWMADLVGRN